MILTFPLAALIGVSLGLVGGGGTMLMVPIFMYAAGLGAKEAIASSLLVVALSSAVGALHQRRHLDLRTGLVFGAAGMVGAYSGGRIAAFVPPSVILALFTVMMLVTAVMMLRSRASLEPTPSPAPRSIVRILIEGVTVGVVTGLVGAGGGFLVVPALVLLGGLPMKRAIATSLFVIAVKSLAGFAGYLGHVEVDVMFALAIAGIASIGVVLGGWLSRKLSAAKLKEAFAVLTIAVSLFMISKQLPSSIHQMIFVDRWPWWAGGAAIAAIAVSLLYFKNQLLGVSTGCAELSRPRSLLSAGASWRVPFLGGIVLGGAVAHLLAGGRPLLAVGAPQAIVLLVGGLLIGFGSRTAGGCTSGHAIVGVAQGARSSIVATIAFLGGGFVTTHLMALLGGPS